MDWHTAIWSRKTCARRVPSLSGIDSSFPTGRSAAEALRRGILTSFEGEGNTGALLKLGRQWLSHNPSSRPMARSTEDGWCAGTSQSKTGGGRTVRQSEQDGRRTAGV